MLISIRGDEKVGKSHFAATAPTPIIVFDLDEGFSRVLPQFKDTTCQEVIGGHLDELRDFKDYNLLSYPVTITGLGQVDAKHPLGKDIKVRPAYLALLRDFDFAARCPDAKTLVIDTGTILWEMARLAYKEKVGKESLMARDYGDCNAEMRAIINYTKAQKENPKHLILLHHNKDVYVEDKFTGETMADGCKHIGKMVDVILRMTKENRAGKVVTVTEIEDSGIGRDTEGKKFIGLTFNKLVEVLNGKKLS